MNDCNTRRLKISRQYEDAESAQFLKEGGVEKVRFN